MIVFGVVMYLCCFVVDCDDVCCVVLLWIVLMLLDGVVVCMPALIWFVHCVFALHRFCCGSRCLVFYDVVWDGVPCLCVCRLMSVVSHD